MIDQYLIKIIRKPLNDVAKKLAALNIDADQVTWVGFLIGVMGMLAISLGAFSVGLLCILLNRLGDGLDGAMARINGATDFGGFLDICLDFIFYSGVVMAFAFASPDENALAAAFLIFCFMGTGSSFLAFAVMAEKRGLKQKSYGPKSLYFIGGLTEGFETILVFVLMCLLPDYFAVIAYLFGVACLVTTSTRIYSSYLALKVAQSRDQISQ